MEGSDRLLRFALVAAGVAGLGISVYLTVVHYSTLPLACSASGVVDCERVLSSPYGGIGTTGIPTALAGVGWFGGSLLLGALEIGLRTPSARLLQLAWSGLGLATVLYLVYVEIDRLGAICLWCTGAHLLVLLIFLASLYRWLLRPPAAT